MSGECDECGEHTFDCMYKKRTLLDDERLKLDHYLNYSYEIITELLTQSQDIKIKEIYQDMTLLHITLIKAKQAWNSINA